MPKLKSFRDYVENEVVHMGGYNGPTPPFRGRLTIMSQETEKIATMSEVVMKKTELLNRLIDNKAKHDIVLATAISGYWDIATNKLEAKRTQLSLQINEWGQDVAVELDKIGKKIEKKEIIPSHVSLRAVSIDTSFGLVYPQDHSNDYNRAIAMMEASVYDEVRLSVSEFDAYVLNNWEWKNNFISSNTAYVNHHLYKYSGMVCNVSGAAIPFTTGVYSSGYQQSSRSAADSFTKNGISSF